MILKIISIMFVLFLAACSWDANIISQDQKQSSTLTGEPCPEDQVLSEPCLAAKDYRVTKKSGTNVTSWNYTGGKLIANIPDGYYSTKQCAFEDTDLTAANIVNGVSIFGVTGTANGPYTACTDNALNASQCSTAASRYVYSAQYGGRNLNCSAGANATACWTNATNQYVTGTAGSNISGSDGSLSATITAGYYSGSQTATMSDTDLLVTNIRSGISIFGVTGTYTGTFPLNMLSLQHHDRNVASVTLQTEAVTNAGTAYTNSNVAYRAVPRISKDDEGMMETAAYVDRTGWGTTTCGTSQATIDLRIANCASVLGGQTTWDGAVKGYAGQAVWKLVSRTGDISSSKGREVWRDERTKLLWSSRVATALNWCKASGSNFITNNPTAEDDPANHCDNASYQNTGTGPTVKAISACFEDGNNYFTSTDANIDNGGKAGLNLASVPAVAWRLPTLHDYFLAEIDGLRFVVPDADNTEWSATIVSFYRNAAWVFDFGNYYVFEGDKPNARGVRCIGR